MRNRSLHHPASQARLRRTSREPFIERLEERVVLSTMTESLVEASSPLALQRGDFAGRPIAWVELRRHERAVGLREARLAEWTARWLRLHGSPTGSASGDRSVAASANHRPAGSFPVLSAPAAAAPAPAVPVPSTMTTAPIPGPYPVSLLGLVLSRKGGGSSPAPVNTNLGPPGTITTSNNGWQTSAANAVTVDGSGNIVVAGSGNISGTRGFQVDRYTPTGALDTTFGTGGGVNTEVGSYKSVGGTYSDSRATAVDVLPGGDVLAAGGAGVGSGQQDFALVFYTPSGKLDTTKGGGSGEVITSVGTGTAILGYVALQTVNSTTKILVAGTLYNSTGGKSLALARYNLDGTLDTSFGTGGKLNWALSGASLYEGGLAIDSSGRIVVAGSTTNNTSGLESVFISRWNANGTALDTTFGNGSGYVIQNPTGTNTSCFSLAIQPDGKIVVGGGTGTGTSVMRNNPDGSPDTSFGTGGASSIAGGPEADGIEILGSGDILLTYGAYYGPYANEAFGLAWLTPSGALDANFGGGTGIVTTELPQSVFPLGINPLAIQPSDGKILEVGTYGSTPTQFAMVRYNPDGSLDTTF